MILFRFSFLGVNVENELIENFEKYLPLLHAILTPF
jgi:hypothetical protein